MHAVQGTEPEVDSATRLTGIFVAAICNAAGGSCDGGYNVKFLDACQEG